MTAKDLRFTRSLPAPEIMPSMRPLSRSVLLVCFSASLCIGQTVPLPSSKQIVTPVPGSPQRLNSLPMTAAWSPDHRYLALVNAGYGTVESDYEQSVAILDTTTGKLTDYPIPLTNMSQPQTLCSGITFSGDGSRLYLSFDSISEPTGKSLEDKAPEGGGPAG